MYILSYVYVCVYMCVFYIQTHTLFLSLSNTHTHTHTHTCTHTHTLMIIWLCSWGAPPSALCRDPENPVMKFEGQRANDVAMWAGKQKATGPGLLKPLGAHKGQPIPWMLDRRLQRSTLAVLGFGLLWFHFSFLWKCLVYANIRSTEPFGCTVARMSMMLH